MSKVAIVTGGSRGIGAAISMALKEAGYTVAANYAGNDEAAAKFSSETGIKTYKWSVADYEACQAGIAKIEEELGPVAVLVNNAGITQPLKIMDIQPENYDAVLDVNLRGTLYMSQAAIPGMRRAGSGSIVNLSSVSAQRGGGIFGGPHYSAAKAGILGLTKAMARELAPSGVRVNAICPGFIATDITAGKLTPEMKEQILEGIPMGRAGEDSDVAGCALFLASDLSAYCTGTEVDVNGGSLIH